jgi:hypothetical protein
MTGQRGKRIAAIVHKNYFSTPLLEPLKISEVLYEEVHLPFYY